MRDTATAVAVVVAPTRGHGKAAAARRATALFRVDPVVIGRLMSGMPVAGGTTQARITWTTDAKPTLDAEIPACILRTRTMALHLEPPRRTTGLGEEVDAARIRAWIAGPGRRPVRRVMFQNQMRREVRMARRRARVE